MRNKLIKLKEKLFEKKNRFLKKNILCLMKDLFPINNSLKSYKEHKRMLISLKKEDIFLSLK
jgi:hypothetical protein